MAREREPLPSHVQDTPELPTDYHDVLDRGLAAMALTLDDDVRAIIDGHVRLLLAWTNAINLTAVRDPIVAATAHVLDSLAAVAPLRARGSETVLDLGSGGGFPGVPLAAALPARDALLVEPIGKKARFLATVLAATGADRAVRVAATRAETLAADPHHRGRWDVVTARAVGSLAELVELGLPLLRMHGVVVAWKRGDLVDELAAAGRALDALGGGAIDVIDPSVPGLPEHRLVVVARAGAVPAAYPRDRAVRVRRPW
jgi:16S rRNA (guanine527-N7)-methyltransferase